MDTPAPQPKVIRMHHEHFRELRDGDEWALAVDLGLEVGEKVIGNSFTKSGHGIHDANMEVIEHPDGSGNGTALRVNSIITPMVMRGPRWSNANVILTIERDGTTRAGH